MGFSVSPFCLVDWSAKEDGPHGRDHLHTHGSSECSECIIRPPNPVACCEVHKPQIVEPDKKDPQFMETTM